MKLGKLLADAGVVSKEHFKKTLEAERALIEAQREAKRLAAEIRERERGSLTPYRDLNLRQLLPAFVEWRNKLPKNARKLCCSCGKRGVIAHEFRSKVLAQGITSLLRSQNLTVESAEAIGLWLNGEVADLPKDLAERAMMLSGYTTSDSPHPNKLLEPLGSFLQLQEFQMLLEFVPRYLHAKLRELHVCRECIAKHDPRFAETHRGICAGYDLLNDPVKAKEHLTKFFKETLATLGDSATAEGHE